MRSSSYVSWRRKASHLGFLPQPEVIVCVHPQKHTHSPPTTLSYFVFHGKEMISIATHPVCIQQPSRKGSW